MGIVPAGFLVLEYIQFKSSYKLSHIKTKTTVQMQASLIPMKGREAGQRKFKPEEKRDKKSSRNDQRRQKHEEKRNCFE